MNIRRHRRAPATVPTTAGDFEETDAARLLEAEARLSYAGDRVEDHLRRQSYRLGDQRNPELVQVLLDLRSIVRPSDAAEEVLRERAAVRS